MRSSIAQQAGRVSGRWRLVELKGFEPLTFSSRMAPIRHPAHDSRCNAIPATTAKSPVAERGYAGGNRREATRDLAGAVRRDIKPPISVTSPVWGAVLRPTALR